MRCFLNVASLLQSRMSIGNEFQADGAETAKALSVNRRRVRGVMKSPLDLERRRLSVHVWQKQNLAGLAQQTLQGAATWRI